MKDEDFTSRPHHLRWYHMFFAAMGVPGCIFTVFGYSLGAVGTIMATALWSMAAIVAIVQNHLWFQLSLEFGARNGSLAMFAAEGWKRKAPIVAPIVSMSYWIGWIVSVPMMAEIAAQFFLDKWFPWLAFSFGLGPFRFEPANTLAIIVLVVLSGINLRGVEAFSKFAYLSGILLFIPIVLCLLAPLFVHDWSLQQRSSTPLHALALKDRALVLTAWLYTIVYCAYASEIPIAFAGEYRSLKDFRLASLTVGFFALVVFSLVPLGISGMADAASFVQDPADAFVKLFQHLAPIPFGSDLIVLTLVFNIVIAVSGGIGDSARALQASALEGMMPRQLEGMNRYSIPQPAILAGLAFSVALLAANASPIALTAIGNIGCLVGVVLGLSAYVIVRPDRNQGRLPVWPVVAAVLVVFNLALLLVGVCSFSLTGYGGWREVAIGFGAILSSIVFFVFRRYVQNPASVLARVRSAAPAPP